MTEWILKIINSTGYPGIIFLLVLENVFPPIPSEFILPLCGYLAAQGKLNIFGVIVAGTIGSILGALPFYFVGYKLGEERLKNFTDKYGKWLTIFPADVEKANRWFNKHGKVAVFFCRLIPGLRSMISIPAGVNQMNLAPFLFFTALGAGIWNSILTCGGYFLGSQFGDVENYLDPFIYTVIGVIVIIYIYRIINPPESSKKTN